MTKVITLEEVVQLAKQLSPVDQVRLLEQMMPQIKQRLVANSSTPRKSLRGLWRGLDITDEEIAQMRQQVWENFPRENIS